MKIKNAINFLHLEMNPCACKGIRHCGLCEHLAETKERVKKFKRPVQQLVNVIREDYSFVAPQLTGVTVLENFVTEDEERQLIERMDRGKFFNFYFLKQILNQFRVSFRKTFILMCPRR